MENSYSLITPEGETVASVGVLPLRDRHLVHRLWVHPDYRGQGLAHRLLGEVAEDADREGVLLESHPWGLQDVHDEEQDRALYSGQGVVPQAPRTAVEALHARHGFSPLVSGEGFRPWVREPGRGLSAVAEAGRSTVYHLTDDPRFKLKDVSPEDNSLSINPRDGRRGLYVGDPMTWASPPYNYKRPYVVELSVPSGTQERGRWGGENFIPAESFGEARVERVMPFDHYVRREWNSPGETEEHMGKTYDTGEPLDRSKRSWQMSYPDTVDTKKEIDTRNPQQWSDQQHLDYLKARRDLLHDVHGWGWNEFDDQGGWRTPEDDEFDRNGEFIRRDREGKQMTRERRASTRTAAVNPIKPHLPWADLQGLTPHESSFQRSHPMVRRGILTNMLQAGNLKAYNRLLPIHRAQSQVDTIRARQGRPSPYMPHWQQQPYGNPAQHPMGSTVTMPRVTAAFSDMAGRRLTWDEIGERHPEIYGDPEVHGEAADGADGEGIGWAASHLAFERPGHEEPDEGSYDLDFHLQDVPVSQIDYARHGAGDPRVRSAERWYAESPDEVVPPVLVHRHGVYQVADGHHRGEAAALLGKESIPAYVAQSPHEDEPFSDGERAPYHGAEPAGSMRHEAARVRPTWDNRMQEPNKLVEWPRQKVRGMLPEHTIHYSEDGQGARCGTQNPEGSSNNVTHVTCAKCRSTRAFKMAPSPRVPNGKTWAEVEREDRLRRRAAVDESGLKAAGIAVIAMDTGRVLMQQRALNPLHCPCGLGVTWDDMNGYQHDDGSVSHDGEFYGQSVSDLLDQGHPEEDDSEGEPEASEDGLDKTAALEYDPNEGTWEFPGGKIDPGESPRDAARREFQEEVGQALPPGVFAGAWVSPGGLRALAVHHVAVQPGDPMYGYGSGHTAPTHSEGYRDTLDNMEDMMPNYLEHPEWYGNGSGEAESEAWLKARRASGNPDKRVRIYRAVPHGISKIYGRDEMSTMLPEHDPNGLAEWVSTSKKYAQEHALAESCPKCGGHLQVISGIARAGDLVNEGYPTEFGYQGAETLEHSGSNRIYKTKCPAPKRTPKTSEQLEAEYDQVKHLGLEAVQKWEAENEADRMLRLRPKRRRQAATEPGFRELGWKPGGYEGEWWRDDPQTGTRHSAERDGEEWYLTSTAPEDWEALPWQTHMSQPEVAQGVQDALQYRESTHMTPAEVHAQSKINDAAYGGMGEYVPKRLGRPGYGLDPAQTVHDYVADPEDHMRRLNSTDQGSLGSTDWWKWANAADPLLSGADPRGLQGDQQYGIDGVCPVPGRGGPQDTMPAGYGVADQVMPPQDPSIAPRTAADLPQRQPMSEAPDEHKLALIKAGWKPSQPWEPGMSEHLRLQPDFTRTSPATGIYHNVSWNGRENKWMYDATVPHWDNASFRMTRRSINPNDPRRNLGGRGNIPLSDPAEVEKAFRGSERAYLMGSEHGEPGIAKMFSDRSGSPYDEEYPDLSAVTQRSEPAFERRREGDPMKGTHPEPDVRYDDLRIPAPGEPWVEGYHNMDMLEEPPHMNPTWGIEKLNRVAKAPVYKGFIYLIEHEKDIDLTQREIHNPDDPDGDMTEQSAWWDIEDAKNNPALRKECKEGTPWRELEMWADQSVRNNKEIKEAFTRLARVGTDARPKDPEVKLAMPTTQHEPVVIGTEGSGEGAITRRVELPSGTWHAKSPVQYDDEGFPVGEFDEPDEEDADPDYWHNRQQDAVNREVFASKLGRAISNPDDEPLTPEVIQGTKASDPGPTAYSRTYPQYRDMQFGWLNHDDIEHHINSQRGQQHGFLHTVLGDGDKLDNNNMLLLGDPMEESSEKIQKMSTVSIDHTRTTLPAYAEARIEDPSWAKRLRFSHPNGEASDYAMRHFVEHAGRDTTPKAHNPLAPGDAERAIAASETMRPWAREQGVEHWLDAAQDRMRGLGEHASGTESMFPYQMAHERSMEHAASLQKQAITWDAVGQHADGCPTYQMRLMNQDDPVQAYVTDHTGHGGRMRWKITRNGVMQEEGKARRQYWTDQDVLNAYDRVVAQPPAQHEAATHWWLVPTS